MNSVEKSYEDIKKTLSPYGLYLQRKTLPDDETQGFAIEPGIQLIAIALLALFLDGFFKKFGDQASEGLVTLIKSLFKGKRKNRRIPSISDTHAEEILKHINRCLSNAKRGDYSDFRSDYSLSVRTRLFEEGMPSNRATDVAERITVSIEYNLEINKMTK